LPPPTTTSLWMIKSISKIHGSFTLQRLSCVIL
jgi:hypothetical protein